jgi:hypothetical protein
VTAATRAAIASTPSASSHSSSASS